MKRISVQSSNVASIGYDAQAGVLEVEFLNGGVYQYFQVDPQIYKAFLTAASKGKFLHRVLKGSYSFKKVRG